MIARAALARVALLAALLVAPAAPGDPAAPPGVFVLGIDGVDPVILQRMMDEGKLPHFSRLAAEGSFQPLGTVNPPQSPVAWSSFVTGMDPGGHGIYDFVHRDPRTYLPIASSTPPLTDDDPAYLDLFGWILPLGGEEPVNARSGTPFWDVLNAAGVKTEVYRMPGNYPVPPSDALTLSGMGTVDMRGEFGKYTWYTDDAFLATDELKADVEIVTVEDQDLDGRPDTVHTRLKGPPDFLHLKPGAHPGPNDYLVVPVTMHIDPEADVVWIRAGDSEAVLQVGEFSDWLTVSFDPAPATFGAMALSGIVRFYVKQVRPTLAVYASPVNIDPSAPAQTIATPDDAAEELCEAIGLYWTQGFPEEINALKDGLFDDDDYSRQIGLVHAEAERMLDEALARFRPGDATFMYLSDIDLQCHMLWRHGDPKDADAPHHPAWEADSAARHALAIEGHYGNADRLLGRTRDRLPPETLLIVMSDHGFQAYTRQVHLNAWLREHGWLVLKHGEDGEPMRTGDITHGDVDWSRTRAYGLGFNSLYLNLAGREAQGIVPAAEADAVLAEISAQLLAFRDPQTGRAPVLRTYRATEAYSEARRTEAPDLIVGYDAGYGCSDASTLGEITEELLQDNTDRWSGNHLMAPEVVPGILLVNRTLEHDGHDLTDLTVTLLEHFGLPPAEGMIGRSIFEH